MEAIKTTGLLHIWNEVYEVRQDAKGQGNYNLRSHQEPQVIPKASAKVQQPASVMPALQLAARH
jgi:hypothetical protein